MFRTDYIFKWKISLEKHFQKELFKCMEKDGFICYHIPDSTYEYRLLDGIIIDTKWVTHYLELKIIDTYTFNISRFEPSQIAFMNELLKRWTDAYIAVYSLKNKEYVILTYRELLTMFNERWGAKLFTTKK